MTTPLSFVLCPLATAACVLVVAVEELELSCASADGAQTTASTNPAAKARRVSEDFMIRLPLTESKFRFSLRPSDNAASQTRRFRTIVGAVIYFREKG